MRESGWGWDAFLRISRCRLKCATFDRSALSRTCRSSMDAPSGHSQRASVRSKLMGWRCAQPYSLVPKARERSAQRADEAHALRVSRRIHDDGLGHGLRLYSRACGRGQSQLQRTNGRPWSHAQYRTAIRGARWVPGPRVQPVSRTDPSTTARVPITLPLATVESVTCQ